jgi:hypothetical protein
MEFDQSTAVAVMERPDGLMQKDTFDLSTAVPVEKAIPQLSSGESRYSPPLTDKQRAESLVELSYLEKGQKVPIGLKADWALSSPSAQMVSKNIIGGLLTGGIGPAYSILKGIANASSPNSDVGKMVFDSAYKGLAETQTIDNLGGAAAKAMPELPWQVTGTMGAVAEILMFMPTAASRVVSSLSKDNQFNVAFNNLRNSPKWTDLVTHVSDKVGQPIATVEKQLAQDLYGLKPALMKNQNYFSLLARNLKNSTGIDLAAGLSIKDVSPKVGQSTIFTDAGGIAQKGTIKAIEGERVTIDMNGKEILATLSQLSVPKVEIPKEVKPAEPVKTKPEDFATAEEYVASKNIKDVVKSQSFSDANQAMRNLMDDRSHGNENLSEAANLAWKETFGNLPYADAPKATAKHVYERFISNVNEQYRTLEELPTKSQLTAEFNAAQGITPPPPDKPTAVSPGEPELPEPIGGGKKIKTIIRDVTGQEKGGKKILDDRQALRETLKAQVKAATGAKIATREEIFDTQSNIIKLIDEADLELKDKAKFIKTIKNIQTQEQLKSELPDIERRINRLLENKDIKKKLGLRHQQLAYSIIQKKFEKVDNLRTAMGLPPIRDMKIEQVEAFEAELGKYQEGDVFLTQRQLETVENTDLAGIKTLREAREALAKEAGVPVSELSMVNANELDRMTYDVALAAKNPFYNLIVEEYHYNKIQADLATREFEQELNTLTNKARASRKQELADVLVPTDKLVFEYLSNPSAELVGQMTPEELDLAFFLEAKFSDALEYLVATEALKTGRENYITNIRRGAFEAIKEDGLVAAFKEALDQYKQDEAVFNILDSVTGQILPLEKFFQFAMQRKGGIKPSQNVAKAASVYFRTLYTKQALDKFVPKMMIYVDALTPTKLTQRGLEQDQSIRNFIKEWINSKKGRKVRLIAKQGGAIDVVTTGLKAFISILDLGLNIPAGIAANVGESAASFVALGGKQTGIGVARLATKHGKAIVKKYEGFVGRTVWDELQEPSKDIGDKFATTLFGLFSSSTTRANKIGLLGSMTESEFKAGELSADRLLDIKMTLGRFRIQSGMKSVLENTTEGGILTQYKTWALPILTTIVSDLAEFGASASKGTFAKKEAVELSRALMVTLAALAVGSFYDDSKKDYSFTGQLIRKVKREALTIIGALDPEMWLGTPRMQKWLADLGTALKQLIVLEKYKSKAEKYKDKIRGVEATKRLFIPRALKQFDKDKTNKKKKIRN